MLRYACGTQRQQGYARLQAAITDGDVSTAASVAQELARIAAVVPSLQPPDRASTASSRAASSPSSVVNPPRRPDSPTRAEASSPKACRDPLLSRSAPGGTSSPPQAAGVQPLIGGAWMRGEARHDG